MTDQMGNTLLGILEVILVGVVFREAKLAWTALHSRGKILSLGPPQLQLLPNQSLPLTYQSIGLQPVNPPLRLLPPSKEGFYDLAFITSVSCDKSKVPIASVPVRCIWPFPIEEINNCNAVVQMAPGLYWTYEPVTEYYGNPSNGQVIIDGWNVMLVNNNNPGDNQVSCPLYFDGIQGEGKIDFTNFLGTEYYAN